MANDVTEKLVESYEQIVGTSLDPQRTSDWSDFVNGAVADGAIDMKKVSLKKLSKLTLGEGMGAFNKLARGGLILAESGSPVESTAFSTITGQLMFSEIRAQFDLEQFAVSQEVPTIQSKIKDTETVPSIVRIGDESQEVLEGQDYETVRYGEEYFTVPAKKKRGLMVDVTEEAIFFDKTGQVLERAREVGLWLATKREKDLIDILIGQVNNYIRNGTATNTYLTSGAYVNDQSSLPLTDWRDIETAELLFDDLTDPTTGEPIEILGSDAVMFTMPYKRHTARHILNATEVSVNEALVRAAAVKEHVRKGANPVSGAFRHVSTKLLFARVKAGPQTTASKAREWWFIGNPRKAFAWYENWPLSVAQQGPDSNASFEKDVPFRFKARYRGVAAVREPRYMVRLQDAL